MCVPALLSRNVPNYQRKRGISARFLPVLSQQLLFGMQLAACLAPHSSRTHHHTRQEALHMLVLSRKLNQNIQIGENITISVVRIKGNVVQLGIQAPPEIHVLRGELLERDAALAAKIEQRSAQPSPDVTPEAHGETAPTLEGADSESDPEAEVWSWRGLSASDELPLSLFIGS
jgi:carbon storage regulator CsrA